MIGDMQPGLSSPPPDDLPAIPAFFTPADLPDWLRADPAPAPISSVPAPHMGRARLAWGSPERDVVVRNADDFRAVSATALARLVPQQEPPRRARRWNGFFHALLSVAAATLTFLAR